MLISQDLIFMVIGTYIVIFYGCILGMEEEVLLEVVISVGFACIEVKL